MKKNTLSVFVVLLTACMLFSCGTKTVKPGNVQTKDSLTLKYAEGFSQIVPSIFTVLFMIFVKETGVKFVVYCSKY